MRLWKKPEPLSVGLGPNTAPRKPGQRRLSKGAAIAIGAAGVLVGAVFVSGLVLRTGGHHPAAGGGTAATTGRPQGVSAAAGKSIVGSLHDQAKATPPPARTGQSAAAIAKKAEAKPVTTVALKTHRVSATQQLVQQAWMQYVSGVIQQTGKLDDERRKALAAGLASGSGGSGRGGRHALGAATITPVAYTGGKNPLAGMFGGSGGVGGGGGSGAPSSFGSDAGIAGAAAAAEKSSYIGKLRGNADYLPSVREAPVSPDVLRAGTVIPGEMETGIDSDLPGQILARVTANVYNTPDGSAVLIPQGATLVGTYDDRVSNGQSRVLVVWNRIIYPDGSSLDIGSMPGADPSGFAGFHDEVDNHYFRVFGDALLLSVFSAGVQLSQPQASANSVYSSQQVVAGALGQQLGQTGQNLINRDINIAPTLKIRPGYRFTVMVTRDLVIKPWEPAAALALAADPVDAGMRGSMWAAEPMQRNDLARGGLVKTNADEHSGARLGAHHFGKPIPLAPPVARTPHPAPTSPRAAPMVPPPPLPPPLPPEPAWSLNGGQLVGRQIERWGGAAGWHVIWNVGQDWPIPRRATFHGSFATAAGQVIRDMAIQGAPVHATFYRGNRTLVVEGASR